MKSVVGGLLAGAAVGAVCTLTVAAMTIGAQSAATPTAPPAQTPAVSISVAAETKVFVETGVVDVSAAPVSAERPSTPVRSAEHADDPQTAELQSRTQPAAVFAEPVLDQQIVRAPVVVYVAPGAQGTGQSADDPAGTVEAAQKAMVNLGGKSSDVDVVFAPGEYHLPGTKWWTPSPGNRVRFLPADWTGGACPSNQPTFVGTGGDTYWLNIEAIDAATRFEISCMTVRGYPNGVRISGGYEYHEPGRPARGKGAALPSPKVTGMTFAEIGTSYAGWAPGFAAVHLQNTDDALVHGNQMMNIRNTDKPGNMHVIYAVYSTDVAISANTINGVSGDAVRTRASSSGRVWDNSVSGAPRAVSDWWCDTACAASHGQSIESPSSVLVG